MPLDSRLSTYKKIAARGRQDPLWFIHKMLGVKIITRQQRQLIQSVRDNSRTAAPSGHGIGKTFISACLVLWFLYCHPNSKVITTAPTMFQVKTLLWREIRKVRAQSAFAQTGFMPPVDASLELGNEWFALGLSTNDPTRFQGVHAPIILVVFDEATGVAPEIWEAADGLAVGENDRMLAIGNPTDPTSQFKRACDSRLWNTITLSSEDHPNVLAGRTIIPGAVTRKWIADRLEDYGDVDSPLYRARVRGLFPEQGDDMLISLADVERSVMRYKEAKELSMLPNYDSDREEDRAIAQGVDVARFGSDETAFARLWRSLVQDDRLVLGPLKTKVGQDTMATAGEIKASKIVPTAIDDSGLGGGVTDKCNEEGVEVIPINGGERARDSEQFFNRRTEMWWYIREELKSNTLDLPDDQKLHADLTNIKYLYDGKGRVKLESKDKVKERIKRSPDRGDALGLAIAAHRRPKITREPAETTTEFSF